jgi:hypothetical protein
MFLPTCAAAETKITSVKPETKRGHVGDTVTIKGTIETANQSYKIFFIENSTGSIFVEKDGNATENYVEVSFIIPHCPAGSYNITLQDLTTNNKYTTVFTVETNYHLWIAKPSAPKQFQEGDAVPIWLNITGSEKNASYSANITVKNPALTNNTSTITFNFNTTENGHWNGSKIFPQDFTGFAHTNYTGTYLVNATLKRGDTVVKTFSDTFVIGLTNATQYGRCQIVNLKASGYTMANVTVWVNIAHDGKTLFQKSMAEFMVGGIIQLNWTVPLNATYGTYTVKIGNSTSLSAVKPVSDIQNFTVTKTYYDCQIIVQNLDKEPVENVYVRAYNSTGYVASQISLQNGSLIFNNLEATNYTFVAFWDIVARNSEIGRISNVTVCRNLSLNMTCKLAHLKISVKDKDEKPLRFIEINILYNYTVSQDPLKLDSNTTLREGKKKLETNAEGIAFLNNTFVNVNYTLDARRYGYSFNTTHIKNFTESRWVHITCPKYHLILNVSDSRRNPFSSATVKLYEWSGGLLATKNTMENGTATFDATFGKYIVKIFSNGFPVNESIIDLVENPLKADIYCKLYNLQVSIKVVDYFGQGIPNAKVVIYLDDKTLAELKTGSDGKATFESPVIGGKWQVAIYVEGSSTPSQSKTLYVDKNATIEFKIEKYTMFAGFLLETSQAVTLIFLIAIVILFLLVILSKKVWQKISAKTVKLSPEK